MQPDEYLIFSSCYLHRFHVKLTHGSLSVAAPHVDVECATSKPNNRQIHFMTPLPRNLNGDELRATVKWDIRFQPREQKSTVLKLLISCGQ